MYYPIVLFTICSVTTFAQSKLDGGKQLTELAKDVVRFFAPIYLEGKIDVSFDDSLYIFEAPYSKYEKVKKDIGRKYFYVHLINKDKELSSKVAIWVDSHEPAFVDFSHHVGRNFHFISFEDFKKRGLNEKERITTYEKRTDIVTFPDSNNRKK